MLNHLCQPWVNHLRPLQIYKWPGLVRTGMGLQGSTVICLLFFCEIFLENHGLTILDPTKATTGHGWQGPQRYPKIQQLVSKSFS